MMDVVRSNFLSVLPQVENAIEQSVFIAIDTEFTGLAVSNDERPSLFDSMSDRYNKLRRTAQNYTICQFGLSAFLKEPSENRYVAHTFNFYICPQEQGSISPRFSIQASNAQFLSEHNFDFNKWFYGGIPCCTVQQEAILKEENSEEWYKRRTELIGFSRVFQLLVKSKKPLLGHNMLFDVAFMIELFYSPLPAQYALFKETLHSLFPVIIDTKNLCHGLRKKLKDTNMLDFSSLQELFDTLRNPKGAHYALFTPDVCHEDTTAKYEEEVCFHEAGFDAYCVGVVFLRIAHLLAMNGVSSADARPVHFRQYLLLTKPYSNKINVSWGPISYIDLAGDDPSPRKCGWIIAHSRTGGALTEKLLRDQLGRMDFQLKLPNCALIALPSEKRASELMNSMSRGKLKHLRILPYDTWRRLRLREFVNKVLLPSGVLISLSLCFAFYLTGKTPAFPF